MSEIKSFSDYTSKYNSNADFSALFSGICRYTVFLIHR